VWEGRCRSHVQNALWKKEIFGANRELAPETEAQREALPATLLRVVIGVDQNPFVSLCTGAGGLDLGFEAAGFQIVTRGFSATNAFR
jgi:hypothetical protein